MQLVELKPLQPIVGSFVCGIADADEIVAVSAEDEHGNIVKRQQARKRFKGLVAVQRHATRFEVDIWKANGVPANITVLGDLNAAEVFIEEQPENPTISVPRAMADDLIRRGLAEEVRV